VKTPFYSIRKDKWADILLKVSGVVVGLKRTSVTGVLHTGQVALMERTLCLCTDSTVQFPQNVCLHPKASTVSGVMSSIQMGHVPSTK
jgi:hypothetical protein